MRSIICISKGRLGGGHWHCGFHRQSSHRWPEDCEGEVLDNVLKEIIELAAWLETTSDKGVRFADDSINQGPHSKLCDVGKKVCPEIKPKLEKISTIAFSRLMSETTKKAKALHIWSRGDGKDNKFKIWHGTAT